MRLAFNQGNGGSNPSAPIGPRTRIGISAWFRARNLWVRVPPGAFGNVAQLAEAARSDRVLWGFESPRSHSTTQGDRPRYGEESRAIDLEGRQVTPGCRAGPATESVTENRPPPQGGKGETVEIRAHPPHGDMRCDKPRPMQPQDG